MAKDDLFSRISQGARNRVRKVLDSISLDENISAGFKRVGQSFRNDPGQYLPTKAFQNLKTNPITAPKTGSIARAGNQVLENVGRSQPVKFAVKNFANPYLNTQNKPLRILQQVAKGYGSGANLGLVQGPGPQPQGGSENVANMLGSFAGAFNPYSASGKFYRATAAATNPYLSKAVGKFAPGVAQRGASSVANVVQGIGQDKILGRNTDLLGVGIDAVTGFGGSRGQFDDSIRSTANNLFGVETEGEKLKRLSEYVLDKTKNLDELTDVEAKVVKKLRGNYQGRLRNVLGQYAKQYGDKVTKKSRYDKLYEYAINETKKLSDLSPKDRNIVLNARFNARKMELGDFVSTDKGIKREGFMGLVGDKQALKTKPQDQPKIKLKPDGTIDRTQLSGKQLNQSNAQLEQSLSDNAPQIVKAVDPKNKVNLLDYIRTPEKVLKKLGLEENAKLIQKKYGDYLEELPVEIDKVTQWYNKVGKSQDASKRIFQYLDGKKDVQLTDTEIQVAKEMQGYLAEWADKLNLPEDKRIASYITHIFEDDFINKDFDPELAKLISDKLPGSVYDPFLEERLGKLGYVEDAFRALDAYVKRATRKYHMDQALNPLRRKVGKTAEESHLDLDSWQYVKSYVDNVNMRPQKIDRLLDDMIKALPGGRSFGARPTSNITRRLRTMVYRGTLGLNMGSALKNLTQGVNTYAELGEKYTTIGYTKAMFNLARKDPELDRILADTFIQDRNLSAKKQLLQKMDKGLFVFFDLAEKINRSAAYYGAKSKALAQGLTEQAARVKAEDAVRKTQFTFGSVDTPVAMQGDIAKTLLQFQSFNIKQAEFLGEMIQKKEFGKMMRWLGANILIISAFGDLLGMDIKDLIPTVKVGGSPIFTLAKDVYGAAVDAPDRYGNDQDAEDKIRTIGRDTVPFIPAGVQLKKSIEGQRAVKQGEAVDRAGRKKFDVPNTAYNRIVGPTLGVYRTSEAQDYYDKKSGKSESTLLERLLQPKSEVSASDQIILPKTEEGRTYLYNQDKKIIDNYEQDVIDTQYKVYKDEESRQERLDELQTRYQDALARQKLFNKDYPQLSKDAQYVEKSTLGNYDDRYNLIKNELRQVFNPSSKKEVFDYLTQNQRKVNGNKLVTVPVLDDLYKEGIISKFERDLLKSVSFTKDGQIKFKLPTALSGSSKKRKVFTFKPNKINYSKLKINVPELPRIKTQFNTARLNTPVLPRVKLA